MSFTTKVIKRISSSVFEHIVNELDISADQAREALLQHSSVKNAMEVLAFI